MTFTRERPRTAPQEDFLGGRRWTFYAAAAVMAVALLAAIAVTLTRHHGTVHLGPTVAPSAPQPHPTAQPGATTLTSAPAVTWTLTDHVALPYGTDGPRDTAHGWGFADTPGGAVLAAVTGYLRMARGDTAEQRAQIGHYATGPGRGMLLAAVPITQLASPAQVAGFRLTAWTPGQAVVNVALRYTDAADGSGSYLAVELPTLWQSGDWRIQFDTTGAAAPEPLPALTGYIPFYGAN